MPLYKLFLLEGSYDSGYLLGFPFLKTTPPPPPPPPPPICMYGCMYMHMCVCSHVCVHMCVCVRCVCMHLGNPVLKCLLCQPSRAIHGLAIVVGSPGAAVNVDVLGVQGQSAPLHHVRYVTVQHAHAPDLGVEGHTHPTLAAEGGGHLPRAPGAMFVLIGEVVARLWVWVMVIEVIAGHWVLY